MQTITSLAEVLRGVLAQSLVSLPVSCKPTEGVISITTQQSLSFETAMAVSRDILDYRFLANVPWEIMQTDFAFDLQKRKMKVIRQLSFLALKFPEYFSGEDFITLTTVIVPKAVNPKTPEEEFYYRTWAYLRNYYCLLQIHTTVDPDYFGYYSPVATAIRSTGVCSKLVATVKLFIELEQE